MIPEPCIYVKEEEWCDLHDRRIADCGVPYPPDVPAIYDYAMDLSGTIWRSENGRWVLDGIFIPDNIILGDE